MAAEAANIANAPQPRSRPIRNRGAAVEQLNASRRKPEMAKRGTQGSTRRCNGKVEIILEVGAEGGSLTLLNRPGFAGGCLV